MQIFVVVISYDGSGKAQNCSLIWRLYVRMFAGCVQTSTGWRRSTAQPSVSMRLPTLLSRCDADALCNHLAPNMIARAAGLQLHNNLDHPAVLGAKITCSLETTLKFLLHLFALTVSDAHNSESFQVDPVKPYRGFLCYNKKKLECPAGSATGQLLSSL